MSSDQIDTRTRILEATWQLLEDSQGTGVRMSDIAKRAEVSRQAVYLHFGSRSELLIATTRYLDEVKDIDRRLAPSRNAKNGLQRLEMFILAWGNYIPEIYGVARALMAAQEADDAAAAAWSDRLAAIRDGCSAAVNALRRDGQLSTALPIKQSVDVLWTLLSVRNWEHLTVDCGWTNKQYVDRITAIAKQILLNNKTFAEND